jgi:superkiller protein 3
MHGLSSWKAGDPEQAISAFDEALRLDPQHRKSLLNSARVLLETSRPREALERIERALSIEPLSGEGLRLLGRARYELKQIPEAIDAYQRAIALDERDAWAMNNLGLIYIQQDRSDAALPILARAVELRSNSPVFQNNLGTALERTGHFAASRSAYEAALAADSTYGKSAASLARVTPLIGSDTSTVDLPALVAEFQTEVQRWRDTSVSVN